MRNARLIFIRYTAFFHNNGAQFFGADTLEIIAHQYAKVKAGISGFSRLMGCSFFRIADITASVTNWFL
jgi:hypothetical protein